MLMKMPNNAAASTDYYGHGDNYELENDDSDVAIDSDGNFDGDFSEYLWMADEEEFDKLEMQRLEEEALMEECLEAMLEEEELVGLDWESEPQELRDNLDFLKVAQPAEVENSTLNPLAAEFIPTPNSHSQSAVTT